MQRRRPCGHRAQRSAGEGLACRVISGEGAATTVGLASSESRERAPGGCPGNSTVCSRSPGSNLTTSSKAPKRRADLWTAAAPPPVGDVSSDGVQPLDAELDSRPAQEEGPRKRTRSGAPRARDGRAESWRAARADNVYPLASERGSGRSERSGRGEPGFSVTNGPSDDRHLGLLVELPGHPGSPTAGSPNGQFRRHGS
jgi:hypothetical protein